jgi:hypothetical protein
MTHVPCPPILLLNFAPIFFPALNHTYMPLQNVVVEENDIEMVLARVLFCGLEIAIFSFYVACRATLLA